MDMKNLTLILLVVFGVVLESNASIRYRRSRDDHDLETFDGSGDGPYDDDDEEDDEDLDGSGFPTDASGGGIDHPVISTNVPPFITRRPVDTIVIDSTTHWQGVEIGQVNDDDYESDVHQNILLHPAVLAAIIVGGVLLIVLIILLIMFIVYRMRKRDEGSYILDDPTLMIINGDHKHKPFNYMKAPPNDHEFYA